MMISPIIQQTRCQAFLRRHLTRKSGINISDVTSLYTALCVMGPLSRAVLSELTETDMSPKSFPFFTVKEIDIGSASGIRAMNLTHTGEMLYHAFGLFGHAKPADRTLLRVLGSGH